MTRGVAVEVIEVGKVVEQFPETIHLYPMIKCI